MSFPEVIEIVYSSDEDECLATATYVMNLMDKDFDGKISKEEFVKAQS